MGPHTVLNPAVPYWNWIPLGFGWRSDNRRSSLTFRDIAEITEDKDLGGYGLRASGCLVVSGDSDDWANANQVSTFVIARTI